MSTTSDQPGPPPSWLGDIALGVEAWAGPEAETGPPPTKSYEARERKPRAAKRYPEKRREPKPKREIPADEVRGYAKGIILEQLALRARSRRELADKLAAKEVPAEVAEELLDKFEAAGFIDDAEFARLWVASRQRTKSLGKRALAQELRMKGVDGEAAQEALESVDAETEEEAARALVQKKLRSLERFDEVTKTRRLLGMLARKGYSGSMAMSVIRSELRNVSESTGEH